MHVWNTRFTKNTLSIVVRRRFPFCSSSLSQRRCVYGFSSGWKRRGSTRTHTNTAALSKTLKIFISVFIYKYTTRAVWICPLVSKYLHLRAAGERGGGGPRLNKERNHTYMIIADDLVVDRLSRFYIPVVSAHRNCIVENARESSRGGVGGREKESVESVQLGWGHGERGGKDTKKIRPFLLRPTLFRGPRNCFLAKVRLYMYKNI